METVPGVQKNEILCITCNISPRLVDKKKPQSQNLFTGVFTKSNGGYLMLYPLSCLDIQRIVIVLTVTQQSQNKAFVGTTTNRWEKLLGPSPCEATQQNLTIPGVEI